MKVCGAELGYNSAVRCDLPAGHAGAHRGCGCACHRTGPRSPSCSDCEHRHADPDPAFYTALGRLLEQRIAIAIAEAGR